MSLPIEATTTVNLPARLAKDFVSARKVRADLGVVSDNGLLRHIVDALQKDTHLRQFTKALRRKAHQEPHDRGQHNDDGE
jgi:hypothetical protein